MRSILSLLLFGRAQPLLLSSCYLSLRASILRRQTPAAEPGASLSLPHTFHPLGSPLSPRHRAQPAPSPNKQPCFTSVNLPMSLPERDDAIGHVKGKRALSIVQLQRQQATSGRGLAAGTKPRAQPAPLCGGWLRATWSPVSPPGAGKGARETGPKLQSEKKSISCWWREASDIHLSILSGTACSKDRGKRHRPSPEWGFCSGRGVGQGREARPSVAVGDPCYAPCVLV